ncbi:MAG: DUF126 domain-containing protein [Gammaproteobacteria bacterium]|nr:DUF126 domain-containing protein [Gammaproteobacteria bacterium]
MSSGDPNENESRALVTGRVLIDGEAEGEVMRLAAPLSFWGGVDPATGVITQPRHPAHGESVAGKVLAMQRTIGSSSSSAILLELLHCGKAPAALLLGEPDAILALGVVVARELGYPTIPVIHCDVDTLATGRRVRIRTDDGHGRVLA